MTKTAVDEAKAKLDQAEGVALAFREELMKASDAYRDAPSDDTAAAICAAFSQLGAARRNVNQAAILHKTLKNRKERENRAC